MKNKLVKLDTNKYKEFCSYRLYHYKEKFRGGKYTGKWEMFSSRLTNSTWVGQDKPHDRWKLVKLKKPQWNEFLVL